MSKIYDKLKELESVNEDELEHIEIVEEDITHSNVSKKRSFLNAALFIGLFFIAFFIGITIAKYYTKASKSNEKKVAIAEEKSANVTKQPAEDKVAINTELKTDVKKLQPVIYKGRTDFLKTLEKKFYDNPNNPVNANNLSVAYTELQRFSEALKYAEKALFLAPDNAYYWNNLGVVLTYLNIFSDAEKCFKKALELSKDEAVFYYNIANLYERIGNKGFAKENYLSYLSKSDKINPANIDIVRKLIQKGDK